MAAFFGGLGIAIHLTLWFTVFQSEIPERVQSRVSLIPSVWSIRGHEAATTLER